MGDGINLANAVNLDYVFFSGKPGMGGVYVKGGTVYINVNAGIGMNGFSQTMAAASLSHELTHWMQEYAPEEYRELREFIVSEVLKADPAELARLAEQEQRWHKGKALSYDQALDEVVANACQTMLSDSKAIEKLVRQHMGTAQKIADYIDTWVQRVREAFSEVDVSQGAIYDAVRAVEGSLERIQTLWDKGIEAASANYDAEQIVNTAEANENAAQADGVKYQAWEKDEILHLKEQISNRQEDLWKMEPVATVTSEIQFDKDDVYAAVEWVNDKLGLPLRVSREGLGSVLLDRKRINRGFNYRPSARNAETENRLGQAYTTACLAIPDVIERGIEIEHHKNHKGRGYPTWTYAAPVVIDGERGNLAVVVKRTTDNYYDVHSVLTPDGNLLVLDKKNKAEASDGGASDIREVVAPSMLSADPSIAENAAENKTKMQRWSNEEYENLTGGLDEDQLYKAIAERKSEENKLRERIKEIKAQEKEWVDKVTDNEATLDEFQAWTEASGYKTMLDRKDQLEKELRMFYDRWEKARDNRLEQEEQAALKKSGLSESEYFGKQAVKIFGYTPYFYDAGYIMPNGKMLNFSGEKGKHRGSRGQDHRANGQIFANTQNSAAMNRFMNYGNIRIMGESPGIDISIMNEPTAEQYRQIKAFARNVADEEYFSVDFSDERGNNVGTLEYDGTIRPDRIINDIKHYFQTGEIRGAGLSAFYQRWDNTGDDTAEEARGREIAYARIESENAILRETVEAVRALNAKQGKTIERLQQRLHITTTPETRMSDARTLARALTQQYGSGADIGRIAEQLKALGDYILQTETDRISDAEIKSRARRIAREILENASEQVDADSDVARQIGESIKGKKLTLDPQFFGELDGGFEEFRRRNFGRFTVASSESTSIDRGEYTSVSQFYADLQSEYGESYFPDLANEGEELAHIARAYELATPMEVNPFEYYMGEATEELSNRIAMDAMNGVLRANPPTDADRAKARRTELQERIKQLKAEQKISEREAGNLWATVYDLSVALDKAESRYKTLQQKAEYRESQVRAEGRERVIEVKAAERARSAEKIAALKEHYQDVQQRARERRQESAGIGKYRKQVQEKAGKLYEMLAKNDDKTHVPEILKAPLAEFLQSIDFTSRRQLRGGAETNSDRSFGARLLRIHQILANQQAWLDGRAEASVTAANRRDSSPFRGAREKRIATPVTSVIGSQ